MKCATQNPWTFSKRASLKTENLRDQISGGEIYMTAFKSLILKRKTYDAAIKSGYPIRGLREVLQRVSSNMDGGGV